MSIQLFPQLLLEVNCQVNYFLNYCMMWLGRARFWVTSKSKPRLRGRGFVKGLDSSLQLTNSSVRLDPYPCLIHTAFWIRCDLWSETWPQHGRISIPMHSVCTHLNCSTTCKGTRFSSEGKRWTFNLSLCQNTKKWKKILK